MHIVATFDHSIQLELALVALEKFGIGKKQMMAVPLQKKSTERMLFDTIHRSDGISLFDLGSALATICSVLGASFGFVLEWGPILWGLIGAAGGFAAGVVLDVIFNKQKRARKARSGRTEVVLLVHCREGQAESVERILWKHMAFGVARVGGREEGEQNLQAEALEGSSL